MTRDRSIFTSLLFFPLIKRREDGWIVFTSQAMSTSSRCPFSFLSSSGLIEREEGSVGILQCPLHDREREGHHHHMTQAISTSSPSLSSSSEMRDRSGLHESRNVDLLASPHDPLSSSGLIEREKGSVGILQCPLDDREREGHHHMTRRGFLLKMPLIHTCHLQNPYSA